MYRGFDLKFNKKIPQNEFHKIGLSLFNDSKTKIKTKLDDFLLENGSLNGDEIMENWFPEVDAHIFLSHSHKDRGLALFLAGILYECFNIKTFIDSTIWGYSNELLKNIDNKYCLNSGGKTYNYEKRNYSTSHVHLMLSSALNKMIDNTECIFFLNSPNSISSKNEVERTGSPWIFSEIHTSKIIRKKTPNRLKEETRMFSKGVQLNESQQIKLYVEYQLELSHLAKIDNEDLSKWVECGAKTPNDALDNLYSKHPINKKFVK